MSKDKNLNFHYKNLNLKNIFSDHIFSISKKNVKWVLIFFSASRGAYLLFIAFGSDYSYCCEWVVSPLHN